ncbi:N-6 DNA methylase [Parasediminibacterium paludis]|uniref:site-specific DNA-methyltransferase (adenine-specific) n=1 Tax=Parasediminibacterium paludis TaxID=908966 RepID=A0ABV8PWK9_9BACT
MSNISGIIKSIRDIFRKDPGLNGDAQRIEQLGWMIFLKLFDDKDQEKELLNEAYKSPIPAHLQWRNWAANDEGITGDELIGFINNQLFPELKNLQVTADNKLGVTIRQIFDGTNNYMKSGTTFRQAINKLNEIDFNSSKEHHIFNAIYEDILQGLATKKDTGEFYTPRAVTQFIIDMVNPKLGETIIDPACGTAGFLVCAIEHLKKQVNNVADRQTLQQTIKGTELKPLPFMLSVVNLITHDIEVPQIDNNDALSRELTSYKKADKVDIIVANPPFGGVVGDGMETNFPLNYRTKESADLFLILFIQLLNDGGRAGIVLPDGSLTGEGVKARVREKLLTDCNVHTIVRLPQSVFAPYATVNTNLIFFEKKTSQSFHPENQGSDKKYATQHIWYYEHTLPEGAKAYNKTKPIRIEEFEPLKQWWHNRAESEVAWKVPIATIVECGFDLDIKNPNKVMEEVVYDKNKIISNLKISFSKCQSLLEELNVSTN